MDFPNESAVFADTFFYIALLNVRDEHHRRVTAFAQEYDRRVITTQWVLTEVADAFSQSAHRRGMQEYFRIIAEEDDTVVLPVSPQDIENGLRLYNSRPDKEWSLTDCISINAMTSNALRVALTRDHHFQQAGFVPLFAV